MPLCLGVEVGRTPGFSVVFIPILHLSSLSVLYLAGSLSIFLSGKVLGHWPPPQKSVAVIQSLSCVGLFVTTWTAAGQVSPSFTISQSLIKLMSIESVMLSNHLIFYSL